jgi:hypothetical protein
VLKRLDASREERGGDAKRRCKEIADEAFQHRKG